MSVRKGKALTVSFPVIDTANRPERKSGISWTSGDSQISKDGAAFANTTNLPTEIGSTGRYYLALTGAETAADWILIKATHTGVDDVDLLVPTSSNPTGTVAADGGNTALTFKTDLTQAVDNYWVDALITFTTGSLIGQVKKVVAYNGTTKFVTVGWTGLTAAPSTGDRFILIEV